MTNTSSLSTPPIIIDANFAVWAVLPVFAEIETLDRLQQWHKQNRRILAPDLFVAEAISVFRFLTYRKLISSEEGEQAIDDFFNLEIQTIPITRSLSHVAMSWASKFNIPELTIVFISPSPNRKMRGYGRLTNVL